MGRRALAIHEANVGAQCAALSGGQRLLLMRVVRRTLDVWLRAAPDLGVDGYAEVLRFRGLVARVERAERLLARRAGPEERELQATLAAAQQRASALAQSVPAASAREARAQWQLRYAQATAERERATLQLASRFAPLRQTLERNRLGVADLRAHLAPDMALVDVLRVGDRYLAWVVRAAVAPQRVDLGDAQALERASGELVTALALGVRDAEAGAALERLVWAPIRPLLGEGVRQLVLCPDAALAAVPFGALPGARPGTRLLDELRISYVMHALALVPSAAAGGPTADGLVFGGVDYERAEGAGERAAGAGRLPARAARFEPLPETLGEAELVQRRLGAGTLRRVGPQATESALREGLRGRRFVHVATHGFAREDLLAGLYERRIQAEWTSADMERQLAVGHDPMLLSGLALAGANARDGGHGDDGILTALEASYLDLDGCELVTLSACETARGTAESGEGVQGLVSAFQMAGAQSVIASLWKVDDEATRLLMEGLYERLLRKDDPLSPAEALRGAALALRDRTEPDGRTRFAAPRYWAAFVAYGR